MGGVFQVKKRCCAVVVLFSVPHIFFCLRPFVVFSLVQQLQGRDAGARFLSRWAPPAPAEASDCHGTREEGSQEEEEDEEEETDSSQEGDEEEHSSPAFHALQQSRSLLRVSACVMSVRAAVAGGWQ